MIGLKSITGLMRVLQSEDSPLQVAGGVALGMIMGFQPLGGPQNIVLLLLVFFLNVNIGSAFLAAGVFAAVAALLDPLAHAIGYALLVQADSLTPLWTSLINLPIVPFTRFNNTVVLGSFVLSLILIAPVMWGISAGVRYYRAHWREKVAQSGFMKWFKVTKVWNLWDKAHKG